MHRTLRVRDAGFLCKAAVSGCLLELFVFAIVVSPFSSARACIGAEGVDKDTLNSQTLCHSPYPKYRKPSTKVKGLTGKKRPSTTLLKAWVCTSCLLVKLTLAMAFDFEQHASLLGSSTSMIQMRSSITMRQVIDVCLDSTVFERLGSQIAEQVHATSR